MNIQFFEKRRSNRGIALIIVMIVIVVLGILAGGFSYSMRVETKLAGNANMESDLEWLGRSGVELARYVLAEQLTATGESYTAMNQKWAGGIGVPEDLLADIVLKNVPLRPGMFSVEIVDLEKKFNINLVDRAIIEKVLGLRMWNMSDANELMDSIEDWIDPDDQTHINGAESDDYLNLDPPYYAKNGPLDDLSELLLIKGMTEELFWGGLTEQEQLYQQQSSRGRVFEDQFSVFTSGFADLFTTVGNPRVNVNTASANVLQLLPGIDAAIASEILQFRAGIDGVEGTEDDLPFHSVGELVTVPGMVPELAGQLAKYCDVNSFTFEVTVHAQAAGFKRVFHAVLRRESQQDVRVLTFNWE